MHWLRALAWSLSLFIGGLLLLMLRSARLQLRARQAQDESRQRFAQAFVTAPQGMALLTPLGHWLAVNQQFCHLLGRSAGDLRQGDLLTLVVEDARVQASANLQAARTHPQQWECRLKDAFGQAIDCLLSAAWVDGQQPCLILQCQDIREHKRIERLKSEFVATVSHELRTPLTAIAGALGLVVNGALGEVPANMREMLGIAEQNSQRLTLLINDLLDMEKLEAGKMSFELSYCSLAKQLKDALSSMQSYAAPMGVELQLQGSTDVSVKVDPLRLQQVLANLLSNAIKFSPAGSRVILSWQITDELVRVSVRDRGPGISEAFRPQIFRKFAQADASTTRQQGGTGLGLAICRRLIEHMNGRIGFDSSPGQGSTFWFELTYQPLAATEAIHHA